MKQPASESKASESESDLLRNSDYDYSYNHENAYITAIRSRAIEPVGGGLALTNEETKNLAEKIFAKAMNGKVSGKIKYTVSPSEGVGRMVEAIEYGRNGLQSGTKALMTFENNGRLIDATFILGNLDYSEDIDSESLISKEKALEIALKKHRLSFVEKMDANHSSMSDLEVFKETIYYIVEVTQISADSPLTNYYYYKIDAQSGEVLEEFHSL